MKKRSTLTCPLARYCLQDKYAPYHSCRGELCAAAAKDKKNGKAYEDMARALWRGVKPERVRRLDVSFQVSCLLIFLLLVSLLDHRFLPGVVERRSKHELDHWTNRTYSVSGERSPRPVSYCQPAKRLLRLTVLARSL